MQNIKKIGIVLMLSLTIMLSAMVSPKPANAVVAMMANQIVDFIQNFVEFIREEGKDALAAYHDEIQLLNEAIDEISQIQREIDDAMALVNQGKEIANQIEQIGQMDAANVLSEAKLFLAELNTTSDPGGWDVNSPELIKRLLAEMSKAEAIGIYSGDVDEVFGEKYQGYAEYLEKEYEGEMFEEKYKQWSAMNMDTIESALRVIGIQAEGFEDEEQLMKDLNDKSSGAEGNLAVLQCANSISSVMVGQMQKLRQLVMSQSQMQAAYYATQQDQKDLIHAQQRIQTAKEEAITGGKVELGNAPPWESEVERR